MRQAGGEVLSGYSARKESPGNYNRRWPLSFGVANSLAEGDSITEDASS